MPSPFQSISGIDIMPRLYSLRGGHESVFLQTGIDVSIAAAYAAMVMALVQLLLKRRDVLFNGVTVLFTLFLGFRGLTQLLAIWTVWRPQYQLSGWIRAGTMALAIATAVALVRALPALHRLPSSAQLQKEIEERQRAEEVVRERDERFRNFIEGVQDYAIYMLDPEGRIKSWNSGAERIKGYSSEEIIGQHFSRFYPPRAPDQATPEDSLSVAQETGRFEEEGWRMRKDGSLFWANVIICPLHNSAGVLTGYSKVTRDLSEGQEMEARFRTLMEAAPDAMVISNAGGRIELTNLQAERLFGYSRQEMIGEPVDMLIPADLRESYRGIDPTALRGEIQRKTESGRDLRARRKDGTEFAAEITFSPLEGPSGISITAAIRDVTEQKVIAAKLAEKIRELSHSNEALEQFAHIASHDLQEPLRMVASYTQLLAKRYTGRLDADADEFIAYAVDGTQRMKQLIEDLLLYSRAGKGAPPMKEFSGEAALQEAMNNLSLRVQETGASVTHDPLPAVVGCQAQVVQILQNLIGNALKYHGDGIPAIHVAARKGEGEWIFSVADNGIGIDSKYFDRIFQIFQRLHSREEYEGTGIGLAICQRILQQQGGRIWVESAVGEGATFHFSLPAR